jgi:hypothetical protein
MSIRWFVVVAATIVVGMLVVLQFAYLTTDRASSFRYAVGQSRQKMARGLHNRSISSMHFQKLCRQYGTIAPSRSYTIFRIR